MGVGRILDPWEDMLYKNINVLCSRLGDMQSRQELHLVYNLNSTYRTMPPRLNASLVPFTNNLSFIFQW